MLQAFDSLTDQEKLALSQSTGQGMRSDTAILIHLLPDDQLLTVSEMAGTLFPRGSGKHRDMINRLNSFLRYRQVAPDLSNGVKAWYGRTVKEYLDPRYHYIASLNLRLLNGLTRVIESKQEAREASKANVVITEQPAPQAQVKNKKRGRLGFGRKLTAISAAAALFTALTLAAVIQPSFYDTLREQGWRKAVAQQELDAHQVTLEDPQKFYQQIWADYRSQNYALAERRTYQLLASVPDQPKLRGDCFYVLAGIKMETGFFVQALGYFNEAEHHYQEANRPANLYWNAIGMAQAHIFLEETEEAATRLDQAENYNLQTENSQSIAHLHYFRMLMETVRSNYDEALFHGMQAMGHLEQSGNNDYLANTYSEIGFIYALKGNLASSQEYTLRAQALITRLGDEEKHVFNTLNYLVMDRVRGESPSSFIIDSVNQWIQESQQQKLAAHLRWALTLRLGESDSLN